jgi:cell division protein FtsZ
MKFDLPKELSSIIKVIGVGGGGGNAVNHMHGLGIKGVDFIICNTDRQALDSSPVPVKLQLGSNLTEGLGAGSVPERGREAVQENIEDVRQLLNQRTKMVFITAGMGGGTGTGAAPVIARTAREMGILTVGIVTSPFQWEGRRRKEQAAAGIREMREAVDTLLVINNDRLRDLYGNLSLDNAFAHADNVLATAARGIAEIIFKTGTVNVDFQDVKTVMTGGGVAILGMAEADGEDRALRAAQEALNSPLLNDNDIRGAKYVLLNISTGERPVLMDEVTEITDHIQEASGGTADVIWGYGKDEGLGDAVRITIIATGFQSAPDTGTIEPAREQRRVRHLDEQVATMITQPIANPVTGAPQPPAPPVPVETPAEPYIRVLPVAPPAQAPREADVPKHGEPAPQRVIEFDIDTPATRPAAETAPPATDAPATPEKITFTLHDEPPPQPTSAPQEPPASGGTVVTEARPSLAELNARREERMTRLREVHGRFRTPSGVSEYEREPAYKRRNLILSDTVHSTASDVSRYTLSEETGEDGERRVEIRRNNPFLHDNVD